MRMMRPPANQVPFTFTAPNGSKYECYFRKVGKLDGICYDPADDEPRIFVTPKMSDRREMNTCIHEAAHAFFWNEPEYKILRYGNTVSNWLHKLGWRKVADPIINVSPAKYKKAREYRTK
jgi:hypothetical protein